METLIYNQVGDLSSTPIDSRDFFRPPSRSASKALPGRPWRSVAEMDGKNDTQRTMVNGTDMVNSPGFFS